MDINVTLGTGKRVDAHVDGHVIHTDQSVDHGGEASAPEPFTMFLASLATCAGVFVQGFCQRRGIPTDGIRITQRATFGGTPRRLERIELDVQLPADFPAQYVDAVRNAANGCSVKKVLMNPPQMDVRALRDGDDVATQPAAHA